ncbi:MAG: hypothetical protein QNJ22_07595 [Desulfosarcinaceae bacterium]|nr:hypothetical protein [Desulfosarcinaceae bacterium]
MPTKERTPQPEPKEAQASVEAAPNRRKRERRIEKCEGYTYISMVGWMDRRCKKRRESDTCELW